MLVLLWCRAGVALMCFCVLLVSFSSRFGEVLFMCRVDVF